MASHYPTYKQSIILLLAWFLITIVCGLAIIIPFFKTDDAIGLGLVYTLSMLLVVFAGFSNRKNWQLRLSAFPWTIIAVAILATISAQIVLEPLQNVLPQSDTLNQMMHNVRLQPLAFFMMMVIAAPILEEILFRGIIFEGFIKNYKPLPAILVSSFLFGLIHGNLPQGLNAFMIGVLYSWVYWNTKSIIPCITLHTINNGLAFFASLGYNEADLEKTTREWIDNDAIYFGLYFFAIAILGISVWFLKAKFYSPKFEVKAITITTEEEPSPEFKA